MLGKISGGYLTTNNYSGPDNIVVERERQKDPFLKRILIVDDDPDITLTFKVGLDGFCYNKTRFDVHTYNNPTKVLSEFKPNFYDLLLTDINMPHMNGFELAEKILEFDVNIRVCFISAAEVNIQALREVYPKARSIGCFIKKPVSMKCLVKSLSAELDGYNRINRLLHMEKTGKIEKTENYNIYKIGKSVITKKDEEWANML